MPASLTLRLARPDDLGGVDGLLARSYPQLLAPDYAPEVMARIVPVIARARPELLASGRYYVVTDGAGRVVGAGGYSVAAPGPRGGDAGQVQPETAHIRHVASDPALVRQGIGRMIVSAVFAAAYAEGVRRLNCLSTLTAVPFYVALGFCQLGPAEVPITPDLSFPAMRLFRDLP